MADWSKKVPRILGGDVRAVVETTPRAVWSTNEASIYFDVSHDEDRGHYVGFYLSVDDIREILKAVEDA